MEQVRSGNCKQEWTDEPLELRSGFRSFTPFSDGHVLRYVIIRFGIDEMEGLNYIVDSTSAGTLEF